MEWYEIKNIEKVDSPSLVLYEHLFENNLEKMIGLVNGDVNRLMPHVKTNKCQKVIERMVESGITRFKAATIAEAKLAAQAKAKFVMIAHQLVGPKIDKFFSLKEQFPKTTFALLVDNLQSASELKKSKPLQKVYIDINSGMNRSGIEPGDNLASLMKYIDQEPNIVLAGFHVYDGHIHDKSYNEKQKKVTKGMEAIQTYIKELMKLNPEAEVIAGGTPSFTVHNQNPEVICSPGTCVFWDWGYNENIPEQPFDPAALLVTRIISKPKEGIVTVDLGHKSLAAENPIQKRVLFLNIGAYELLSQSEEHGVLKVKNWEKFRLGDVIYGIPYHICPTVNLHREIGVIKNGILTEHWKTIAGER
ncbi:MAG: alanine racemase [Cytophagales bacterium]|nr:alanine racemase [Cytophagales bacterium]